MCSPVISVPVTSTVFGSSLPPMYIQNPCPSPMVLVIFVAGLHPISRSPRSVSSYDLMLGKRFSGEGQCGKSAPGNPVVVK